MATYKPSSSPPFIHSPHSQSTLSPRRQHEPGTLTARKVDLELLRLKGLGKVTKNSDSEDQSKPILTTSSDVTLRHCSGSIHNEKHGDSMESLNQHDTKDKANQQWQLKEYQQQLETSRRQLKDHQQQVHTLKEELAAQYQQQLRQQEQQLQQEMVKYQTQLTEQEKLAHDTISNYMEKIESSQVDVRKLTLLVEKQDQLIEMLLVDEKKRQQQRSDERLSSSPPPPPSVSDDWRSLHLEKQRLTTAIGSLKANFETNAAHMQMMMMVSTEIQNDFKRQKSAMEQQLAEMANELTTKNALIQHYQNQQQQQQQQQITHRIRSASTSTSTAQQQPPRSTSISKSSLYRPIVNEEHVSSNITRTSDISPHPSLVSSSSSSSSSSRSSLSISSSSRPSLSSSVPSSLSMSPPPPPSPFQYSTKGGGSSSITSIPSFSPPPPTIPLPPLPMMPSPARNASNKQQQQQQQQQQYHYSPYQANQLQHGPSTLNTTIRVGTIRKDAAPLPPPPETESVDQQHLHHHGKPFWKSMKPKWRNS